ncbi:MAG TPA: hypothetical protein VJU53_05020, partial [Burkholderiaceae bacterium]|nr:hypothetical protein [Burkholderiaceae bacterium]
GATSWAEARWRELKLAADEVIAPSGVNYFVVRTGRIAAPVNTEPRVILTQNPAAPDAELPCNSLAFLLTGAALSGAANRSRVTVRVDPNGLTLQSAVQAFRLLREDTPSVVTTKRIHLA